MLQELYTRSLIMAKQIYLPNTILSGQAIPLFERPLDAAGRQGRSRRWLANEHVNRCVIAICLLASADVGCRSEQVL